MKLLIKTMFIIAPLYPNYIYAMEVAIDTSCYQEQKKSCETILKQTKVVDSTSFFVEIIDSKTGSRIFPYIDKNETMESVALNRVGDSYIFSKKYLDSTKAIEAIIYKYHNKTTSAIKYLHIESFVDFYKNKKYGLVKYVRIYQVIYQMETIKVY